MPVRVDASHIAGAHGAFEPQRKNNFTVIFTGTDGSVMQKALQSFPFPRESNPAITVPFGNEERKVAGRATFDDVTLVLKDFADQPVMRALLDWRKQVYDPTTGKIGWARDYKRDGQLILSGPDGTVERKWDLKGMWPSANEAGGGDMGDNSQNMISVTLSIDKAIPSSGF